MVESPRRPVALGCAAMAAAVALAVVAVAFTLKYLESGADSGRLVLEDADAYAAGTIEFVGQRNFYLVRLADGSFLALADLDAANRGNPAHRCRVAPVLAGDPELPGLLRRHGGRTSPQAAGATLLLREDCNGAVYDITGLRLDADGPNLDRYAVDARGDGKLAVDVSKRLCSRREGAELFVSTPCP